MITTITLNSSIDKTYYVDGLQSGKVFRVKRIICEPGGKGNNVAKVIRQLGGDVSVTGFIGGANGQFIRKRLKDKGIKTEFVNIDGESRTCINIIDQENGESTELLENGPTIGCDQLAELKVVIKRLATDSTAIVLSGSLPPGVDPTFYGELIKMIQSTGCKAFLDTSGEPLRQGLKIVPYFVKPNESEISEFLGKEYVSENELSNILQQLAKTGITQVCITLGDKGAVACIENELFRINLPTLPAINAVGCGDAFVAGMAYAYEKGETPVDSLKIASAAAVANAMSEYAGNVDIALFDEFRSQIQVIKMR